MDKACKITEYLKEDDNDERKLWLFHMWGRYMFVIGNSSRDNLIILCKELGCEIEYTKPFNSEALNAKAITDMIVSKAEKKITNKNATQEGFKNEWCIIDGGMIRKCIAENTTTGLLYFELNPENIEMDCGYYDVPSIAINSKRVVRLKDRPDVAIINTILKNEPYEGWNELYKVHDKMYKIK
jgi:hypothetical protein